jgi:hypothetical protein
MLLTAMNNSSPSENVTLRFVVQITQHPIFKEPYKLYVVGNIDELGNWNPHEGHEMQQVSEERLEASITIPKNMQKIIEYKYVNITKNGAQVNWEHGENRTIRQIDSEFLQIQDQYRDGPPRHSQLSEEYFALDRIFGRKPEQKISLAVPTNDEIVLVRFLVSAGTTDIKQQIAVSGNCEQLANWRKNEALIMQYTYPHWELEIHVPKKCFPIEYKYMTSIHREFEVGQNNRIDLPKQISQNEIVVQLNDVFRSRYFIHSCMTSLEIVRFLVDEINQMKCQVSDIVYVEDDKLVVGSIEAFYKARYCHKPIKKVKNVTKYFAYSGSDIELESEALLDPECSFREMFLRPQKSRFDDKSIAELSRVLRQNRTISCLEIGNDEDEYDYEDDSDVEYNIYWFFKGLAKNEYPTITSVSIDNSVAKSNLKPLLHSLKTNVTLKALKIASYNPFDQQQLFQALEVNQSLTELSLVEVDSDLLAKTILATRRIKILRISGASNIVPEPILGLAPILRELDFHTKEISERTFTEFFEDMKTNKTMSSLVISAHKPPVPKTKLKSIAESLFESNWTLVSFITWDLQTTLDLELELFFNKKCERNRQYQNQRHENIVTIAFNIGRSKEALALLPREVWLQIFSFVESALGYDYCAMLNALFKDYSVRKVAICP